MAQQPEKILLKNIRTLWFVKVKAWFVVIFGINTTSDISKLLYIIFRAIRLVKFETILKHQQWYLLGQMSRTNHATICLYYYPQRFSHVGISN